MGKYSLAAGARINVSRITQYTEAIWGKEQALRYMSGMRARFQQIADNPEIGVSRPEFGKTMRSFPYESHIIYYRRTDSGVLIFRVLHQHQLPKRHLRN